MPCPRSGQDPSHRSSQDNRGRLPSMTSPLRTLSSAASLEPCYGARAWMSHQIEVANSRACLLYEHRHIGAMTSFVHPRRKLFRAG
jgi:hypothetical protein